MIRAKSDKSVTVAFIVPSNNKERIFRPQTLTIIPRPWDTRTGSPTDLRFSSSTSTTPEAENRDLCCHTYSARMTLHGQTNMPIVILFNVLIATRNFAHVALANRPRAPSVRRTRSPLRLARDQSPPVVQKPAEQADVQRKLTCNGGGGLGGVDVWWRTEAHQGRQAQALRAVLVGRAAPDRSREWCRSRLQRRRRGRSLAAQPDGELRGDVD